MLSVTSCSWRRWADIAPTWRALAAASAASFFLSDAWVASWLDAFGEQLEPRVLLFNDGDAVVGACLLVRTLAWRKVLPMRRWHLNCAGESELDDTAIEYNRLLSAPDRERDVQQALSEWLTRSRWDELMFDAVDGLPVTVESGAQTEVVERPCYFVNLGVLRDQGSPYDALLSPNTRQQVRRSLRVYQDTTGPLTITQPHTLEAATAFLEELADLHQRSWTDRGKPGVFASHRFQRFHARLLSRVFTSGSIQLLRVTSGSTTIGMLYSFLHDGCILFYQSGFAYQPDNRVKPGLVSHYLAVSHYLTTRGDVREYDFLAGDAQYKRSLAKEHRTLRWFAVQRPTLRARALWALRARRRARSTGVASSALHSADA
ncbi:MAG: GNAT family N-acetyltransferase [Vicinamibacterales bacterium]